VIRRKPTLRAILLLGGVAIGVTLWWLLDGTKPKFGIGAAEDDYLSAADATCFRAVVTNKSGFTVHIREIRFEWRGTTRKIKDCTGVSRWATLVHPESTIVARSLIPTDARKFRVRVVCESPDPVRTMLKKLAAKLPASGRTRFDAFVTKNFTNGPSLNSYCGPWMVTGAGK
jgi:hypothetical protein